MKLNKTGETERRSLVCAQCRTRQSTAEEPGLQIELSGKSVILKQFGRQIRELIRKTAEENGVENARISAKDNGALDCTIKARVRAAIQRAV